MRYFPVVGAAILLAGCANGLRALPTDTADSGELTDTEWQDPNGGTPTGGDDNSAPYADAGSDIEAILGDVIQLDGSDSDDPDGDELSYLWDFISMPPNSTTYLINDTRDDPSFYADADGTYVVLLTVTDGLASSQDEVEVSITAPNDIPYANAGPDQSVTTGDTVQLNGSDSWDPDGDALNFTWTMTTTPSGSSAGIGDPTSPLPTFVADAAGRYEISLVVDDGVSSSATDIVAITASDPADDGCFSTLPSAARQWGNGRLSAGHGLALLPLLALLWYRRED